MAPFKIVTPVGASFSVPGVGYKLEMEGLAPISAEIVEVPAGTDDEFVSAARAVDAVEAPPWRRLPAGWALPAGPTPRCSMRRPLVGVVGGPRHPRMGDR